MAKGRNEAFKIIASLLLLALIGNSVFQWYSFQQLRKEIAQIESPTQTQTISSKTVYVEDSQIINTVKAVQNSVVSIIASKDLPKYRSNPFYWDNFFFNDPFFEDFFQIPQQNRQETPQQDETNRVQVGGGSGFIYSEDGLILTNRHVVSDEEADYTVVLFDGTELESEVLARDDINDLAVLRVKAKEGEKRSKLQAVKLGDSASIQVGQRVIAIGNALAEFQNTVTSGIISAKGREIVASDGTSSGEQIKNLLLIDAAINPGNSGGPLVNLAGEVVGMNTAIAQQAQGIGFAIPVDDLKHFAEIVKKHGKYIRPYIGVRYMMLNEEIAKRLNIKSQEGALIYGNIEQREPAIIQNSPADKAGLQMGDIIISVDGEKLTEENDLRQIVSKKDIGTEVQLEFLRNGERKFTKLKLEEYNPNS